jgi:hypothetical protein
MVRRCSTLKQMVRRHRRKERITEAAKVRRIVSSHVATIEQGGSSGSRASSLHIRYPTTHRQSQASVTMSAAKQTHATPSLHRSVCTCRFACVSSFENQRLRVCCFLDHEVGLHASHCVRLCRHRKNYALSLTVITLDAADEGNGAAFFNVVAHFVRRVLDLVHACCDGDSRAGKE